MHLLCRQDGAQFSHKFTSHELLFSMVTLRNPLYIAAKNRLSNIVHIITKLVIVCL